MAASPGYISEHEKAEHDDVGEGQSATPNLSKDEQNTVRLVKKLFDKAREHRAKYDSDWPRFYRIFRGKQWEANRPSYRHSEVINLIFQSIQSSVPILTDSRPKISYVPTDPSDREFAELMTEVAESDWERGNWLVRLTEVVYDAHLYGVGMAEVCFDPDLDNGLGRVDYKSHHPMHCFPDPEAQDVNGRDGRYFIHAEPMCVETVQRMYPHVKDYIKPNLIDPLTRYDATSDAEITYVPVGGKSFSQYESTNMASPFDEAKGKTLLIRCYLKPDDVEEIESKYMDDAGAEQSEYIQKLKYPNGRYIVICNDVICEDVDGLPYEDNKFPYARLVNYILPREFWGISEVEQLESPQKIFNKLFSFALDVLTIMGNPIWIVDSSSGVDTDNLFNRPGSVVEKEPNSEVRREAGVQLQPFVLDMANRLEQWFNGVAGTQDVSRGAQPTGVTAASAISALQEAAQTRLRLKSRMIDAHLQDVGQMYASRVMQYYTIPRVFRITNDQNAEKYFKFHTEKNEDGTQQVSITRFDEDLLGKLVPGEPKTLQIAGALDVRASTGSSLPFSKVEKEQKALNLFDRGIIDPEEVLKAVDWPNKEQVLERLKAREEEAAAAAASAPAA